MVDITIKDFPCPPSVNTYLMPVMGKVKRDKGGRLHATGRLVKTWQHRDYETQCTSWHLKYMTGVNKLKEEIINRRKEAQKNGKTFSLSLEYMVILPESKILTQKNQAERVDADNFLKPLQDNLFKILQIDDMYAFKSSIQKVIGPENIRPFVIVNIKEFEPATLSEIKTRFGIK